MQCIELPGSLQKITKEGKFLSMAKDYFGYKVKQFVVTGADSGKEDVAARRCTIGASVIDTGGVMSPLFQ